MSDSYEYLSPKTKETLNLNNDERIQMILQDKWIGYSRAIDILDRMEFLLQYPKKSRMPNLLIIGGTNQGKTSIAKRFLKKHPGYDNDDGESITVPVMMIESPPKPDEGRLYDIILDSLFAPFKYQEKPEKKKAQIKKLFEEINLKMLIIDEIHHSLAGSTNEQRTYLNVIKGLGNMAKTPIVGFGTKDAVRALQVDPQMSNRFEPMYIPIWKYDNEFLRLLASLEKVLPLKKQSKLYDQKLSSELFEMSEGNIGELTEIISRAATEAIYSGEEIISLKILKKTYWVRPSERKKAAKANV